MTKAPHISKGKANAVPEPTPDPACDQCSHAKDWNDRIYCGFKFPPHVGLDDHPRARLVGTKHWCDLFKQK